VRRLLDTAGRRRNGARWAVALALGLRQGEALGLRWPDIDLDARRMVIRRSRQRPDWVHGCGGTCGRRAGSCPQRQNPRGVVSETKSRAGRRVIGLPLQLVQLLREHRAAQDEERITACQLWHEGDWVFATRLGEPIIPATDYHQWKKLLRDSGVREVRLHDARHTAATVLLLMGVPDRAVMSLMGWSHSAMAARYQHLTAAIHADIAERLGGVIWADGETRTETSGRDDPSEGDG